jgi:hypothetical protein
MLIFFLYYLSKLRKFDYKILEREVIQNGGVIYKKTSHCVLEL